jgi:ribosomal protein L29
MGRSMKDMTVEQLQEELTFRRQQVRMFGELEQTRKRRECLKRIACIEKLLDEKGSSAS